MLRRLTDIGRSPFVPGIFLLAVTLIMSLVALKFLALPFAWAAFFCALAFLAGIWFTSNSNLRALFLNVAVAFMVLGGFEIYLQLTAAPARRDIIRDTNGAPIRMSRQHEVLGYAPTSGLSGTWRRYLGDDLIFDIRYSIDSLGLRTGPPDNGSPEQHCVIFFGGSYTFGSGVNDDETMPYQTGIRMGGEIRTFNFGYRGYGPHQMLAALEHGMVEDLVDCKLRHAIYQFMPDHIRRSAGQSSWDTDGPRFVLDSDGRATQVGHFDHRKSALAARIGGILNRSRIYRKLDLFSQDPDEDSVRLLVAIVKRAQEIVESQDPDNEFHVIFWPSNHWTVRETLDQLQSNGTNVHLIDNILPERKKDAVRYRLHKYDGHPSALAHGLIADYLGREILRQ